MRNKKQRIKRIAAGAIAILIVIAMLLSSLMSFFIEAHASEASRFTITGNAGIGGFYRVGLLTPIEAVITNNQSGKDFTGDAEIRINVSDDSRREQYVVYSYPLELAAGASKKIEMNIIIPAIVNGINITLIDSGGKSAGAGGIPVNAVSPSAPLIGVLSDDITALSYMKQMIFYGDNQGGTALGEKLISIDERTFPSDLEVLKIFSMIVINHFDAGRLSATQKEMLDSFVSAGGTLIIGTGPNAENTLKALSQNALGITAQGNYTNITGMHDTDYLYNTTDWNGASVITAELKSSVSGTPVVYGYSDTLADKPVSYSYSQGSGTYLIHSFDLGLAPLTESYISSKILNDLYSRYLSSGSDSYYYGNNISYLLSNLPYFDNGTITIIFIIIAIYLVIIGPVLFIVLKKKDKRDYAWFLIPATAVCVTVIISIISVNTMYRKPLLNTIAQIDLPESGTNAAIKYNYSAFSPKSGNVNTEFEGRIPLKFFYENYGNYYNYQYGNVSADNIIGKLRFGNNSTDVSFFNQMSWGVNAFQSEQTLRLGDGIKTNIILSNAALSGTIENLTGLDLTDVCIVYGNYAVNAGNIKNGDTSQFTIDISADMSGAYVDYLPYRLLGQPYVQDRNLTQEDRRLQSVKRDLLSNYLNTSYYAPKTYISYPAATTSAITSTTVMSINQMTPTSISPYSLGDTGFDKVIIFAFTTDNILPGNVKINGTSPTLVNSAVLKTTAPLKFNENESFTGYDFIKCNTILTSNGIGHYSGNEIYIYGQTDVIFVFTVPEGFACDFFTVSNSGLFIYNAKNDNWEPLSAGSPYSNPSDYINASGEILINLPSVSDQYVYVPSINATIRIQ